MSTATGQPARKQAPRLARPAARYWKGKLPKGITQPQHDSDSDDNEEEGENGEEVEEEGDVLIGGEDMLQADQGDQDEEQEEELVKERARKKEMNLMSLKDVNLGRGVKKEEEVSEEGIGNDLFFWPLCVLMGFL